MKKHIHILFQIFIAFSYIYPQGFWERTNALDSIAIYSLAINSNGDIFAGSDTSQGLFRSTDNGENWINLGFTNYKIPAIFLSSNGEILLATDDRLVNGGVYRSTDNGSNWDTLGLTNLAMTSITKNSDGDIFVGSAAGGGVYRSTDDGNSWIQINSGLSNNNGLHPTSFLVNSSGHIFTGTIFGGVFVSTDKGDNWVQTSADSLYVLSLGINLDGDIFAGTSGEGVFRSTDNGANWTQINQGLTPGQGYYVYSFAINSNGEIFAATADGVFQSTNKGDNWIRVNEGLTTLGVSSLALNSNGDIFAGTTDGIFRTIPSTNMKIFLQGPYVSATGTMSTTLNTNGYIPLTQPYNTAPWNYTGTESVDTIPAGVVDWILLELRSDLTTQLSRRAAFLLSDGSVVDLDGVSNVKFPGVAPGDYYTVIRHRNHLAVMTASPVTLSYSPVLYDFSTTQTQAFGTNAMVSLTGGFGLFTGDPNRDGQITALDFNTWNVNTKAGQTGYVEDDINLDAQVTALDFNFWNSNTKLGAVTNVP